MSFQLIHFSKSPGIFLNPFSKHLFSQRYYSTNCGRILKLYAYKEMRAKWLTMSVLHCISKDVQPKGKDWRRLLQLQPQLKWNGPLHLHHSITIVIEDEPNPFKGRRLLISKFEWLKIFIPSLTKQIVNIDLLIVAINPSLWKVWTRLLEEWMRWWNDTTSEVPRICLFLVYCYCPSDGACALLLAVHMTPSHLRIFVTIILPKNISHDPIKNIAFIHSIILQQWNLTRLISTLSGKAVLPLVSNPQMTESSGQITKLVQTLFGTQCVSPAASKFVPSSHIKLTPHVPASSEDHKVMLWVTKDLPLCYPWKCLGKIGSFVGLLSWTPWVHTIVHCAIPQKALRIL